MQTAEDILRRANQVIDAGTDYAPESVEVCLLAFQSLNQTFAEENQAAAQMTKLGPMLPDEFKEARGTFLRDLSAR